MTIDALNNLGYYFDENGKMSSSTNPLGDKEVVITPGPKSVDDLPKQKIKFYKEGKQDDGSHNLPQVTIKAELPKSYMGIPTYVYSSPLSRRMYEDRNKAGRDIAIGIATVAAPELGPAISAAGKLMTPSTYTSRAIPWLASKFGMSAPTAATSLVGAGADMALAGYFAHEGYKDVKDAIQHPENLLSWTDYGKLGLDATMMFGPLSEVGKTASALNKNFRIPFLIDARHSNKYFDWANNKAEELLSRLENNQFEKSRLGLEVNRHIRGLAYRPLNFVAGLGLKSKSWLPAIKEAGTKGVQRSMDIFDKYYRTAAENAVGHSIDLGKAEDYTKNMAFSYLPWDKEGILFEDASGHTVRRSTTGSVFRWATGLTPKYKLILSKGKLPVSLNIGLNLRTPKNESMLEKIFRNIRLRNESPELWGSSAVHEVNHEFTKDPTLEKTAGKVNFGPDRRDSHLNKAYLSNSDLSGKLSEKSAVNALLRHYLGLTPEEIRKLPTERFIYIDKNGKVRTIFDEDKFINTAGTMYSDNYSRNVKAILEMLENENKAQGGAGRSEVFPIFAEKWADAIRNALLYSYKKGGKL